MKQLVFFLAGVLCAANVHASQPVKKSKVQNQKVPCYIQAHLTGDAFLLNGAGGNGAIVCYENNNSSKIVKQIPIRVSGVGVNIGVIGQTDYSADLIVGPIKIRANQVQTLEGSLRLYGGVGANWNGGEAGGIARTGIYSGNPLGALTTYHLDIDKASTKDLALNLAVQATWFNISLVP